MAHHKKNKPKPFKGHCTMCSFRSTDGRRNGRIRSRQEAASALKEREETGRGRLPKWQ